MPIPMIVEHPLLPPMTASRQIVLVLAAGWGATSGFLWRLARPDRLGPWQPVAPPVAASLGRGGLAWGCGQESAPGAGIPQKREGDGCSPAGVFPICALFGAAPVSELPEAARLPYIWATPAMKCIDDPASRHYNRIVDATQVVPDWRSCEDLRRQDGRYEFGAVVGYNGDPAVAGAGSCIFLHVREAPGVPTAGCTALPREDMRDLIRWLDREQAPLLVQLPHAEYPRLRESWGLPQLADCGGAPVAS